jgi:hypothetical protein
VEPRGHAPDLGRRGRCARRMAGAVPSRLILCGR